MWIIKWHKVTTNQRDYMREMLNEGKVLQFEWEEDALRFLDLLKGAQPENSAAMSYSVHRFSGDRKEKYKIVKSTAIERAVDAALVGFY